MKLSEIKNLYGGVIKKDGEFDCFGFLNSDVEGRILAYYGDSRFRGQLRNKRIGCVICSEELAMDIADDVEGIVLSKDPLETYWKIFNEGGNENKKNIKTIIGEGTVVSPTAIIASHNVKIGKNCIIEDLACIKENTIIGDNVIIRSNAVVGTPGLMAKRIGENILPIEHFGGVHIDDEAEIHAFVSVEQALFGWDLTYIGKQTKINSFSLIGHASKIGDRCMLASFVTMGGFSNIGNDVWLGPGATLKNQIQIGNGAQILMGSVVRKNIKDGEVVLEDKIMDGEKYERIQRLTTR